MGLLKWMKEVEHKYAWGVFGVLLAVAFGVVAVHTDLVVDRRPKLEFSIVTDAPVLDVREQVGDLAILYGGLDIQKAHKSLRVIVLRVENNGRADILNGSYDDRAPLGFELRDGVLLRAELISCSNQYLSDTMTVTMKGETSATFPPVILEAGESFTIKLLVLHSQVSRPAIRPVGKVAGIRDIVLSNTTLGPKEPGLVTRSYSGTVGVQALRLLGYPITLALMLLAVVAPIAALSDAASRRRRQRLVEAFKRKASGSASRLPDRIFMDFVGLGLSHIARLYKVASDPRVLERFDDDDDFMSELLLPVRYGPPEDYRLSSGIRVRAAWRRRLRSAGFLVKSDNEWRVRQDMVVALKEFIDFAVSQGAGA